MVIDGKQVNMEEDYLSPVTYKPPHAKSSKDWELGVLINHNDTYAKVLYCKSRTVQSTNPEDLVWG